MQIKSTSIQQLKFDIGQFWPDFHAMIVDFLSVRMRATSVEVALEGFFRVMQDPTSEHVEPNPNHDYSHRL